MLGRHHCRRHHHCDDYRAGQDFAGFGNGCDDDSLLGEGSVLAIQAVIA